MTVEVDPYDPEDADAVEVAIATAIADAFAHPVSPEQMTAAQAESIMEAVVGTTLRFYAQRTTQLFISEWGAAAPGGLDPYATFDSAIETAVRRAIDDTGESVRDLIRAAEERIRNARADVFEQSRTDPEVLAMARLRGGMEQASRVLTTRTREEAKLAYASSVGAAGSVWRTRRDGRVRNSHGDLEGEFVLIGDAYRTVTGHAIRRPGDPRAPLAETINCRCRLSYRMPT